MRPLSVSLLEAQLSPRQIPFVEVKASNSRITWECVYAGSEAPALHTAANSGGTIIRARISPPSDGSKLYVQRVPPPFPRDAFSSWQYLNQYNVLAAALAVKPAETSLFYILSSRRIERFKSTDNGATWQGPELLDFAPTSYINGMAAGYNAGGESSLFFADLDTLYVKQTVNGAWQPRSAWTHQSGDLSGIAAACNGDFLLLVSGAAYTGEPCLWRLVYGDGENYPAGEWSPLKLLASAPANSGFSYDCPALALAGTFHAFYNQSYDGTQSYTRSMYLKSPGTEFSGGSWQEAEPFQYPATGGYSLAVQDNFLWLISSNRVFKANTEAEPASFSQYVLSAEYNIEPESGRLRLELDNSGGVFNPPPAELEPGGTISLSPGYITSAGAEVSPGLAFDIECSEYISGEGKSIYRILATDAWSRLKSWCARHQLSWNQNQPVCSILEILNFILARSGIDLSIVSASARITSTCPPFTLNPSASGFGAVRALLASVPDCLIMEGRTAWLVNPSPADEACYSYFAPPAGSSMHPIFRGVYRRQALPSNHIRLAGESVTAHAFDWESIERTGERIKIVHAPGVQTLEEAGEQAEILLAGQDRLWGQIRIPVNAGAQLLDVVEITDSGANLAGHRARIQAIKTIYRPREARFEQELTLSRV